MSAILLSIVVLLAAAGIAFVNQRSFGRLPRGERLERIRRSAQLPRRAVPQPAPRYAADDFRQRVCGQHVGYSLREQRAPRTGVGAPGAETRSAPFGAGGGCVGVVRPFVLSAAIGRGAFWSILVLTDKWPMSLFFSPFKGTDVFSPEDMPDIDCLIVTHDHWDHLDYRTVMQLKERIGRVVCPLGVGEHFEYWGFDSDRIVELDWSESCGLSDGFRIHCLPARHFSGRGLDTTVRSGPRFSWRALRGGSILQATVVTIRTSPRSAAGSRRSTWRWWRTGSTTPTGVTFI